MITREDVLKLKLCWISDPSWDIEDTEGFDEYRDELLSYRLETEKKWIEERIKKESKAAKQLGISREDYLEYEKHNRIADSSLETAKRTLLYYFRMAMPDIDADCCQEIEGIVDSIEDAAKERILAELIKRGL